MNGSQTVYEQIVQSVNRIILRWDMIGWQGARGEDLCCLSSKLKKSPGISPRAFP